jgi:hypothetical protein
MRPLSALCVGLCASACFGCGTEDEGRGPAGARWQRVASELPSALICVTGTSEDDVWAVGNAGFALHYDGTSWTQEAATANDLWWAHAFPAGPVFVGGTGGTILRFENGAFTPMTTPGTGTVFGIWGESENDLWAVGGDPQAPGSAFVWRSTGDTWAPATGLSSVPITSFFKVWGRDASDVRIVGADGVILHYDGTSITEETSPTNRRLLTVHVAADGPWAAVGGSSQAVIVERDDEWKDVSPSEETHPLFGVRLAGQAGYAVGAAGTVLRRTAKGWVEEKLGFELSSDLHTVWIAPDGGVWAAGGDLLATPMTNGVLLHAGKSVAKAENFE